MKIKIIYKQAGIVIFLINMNKLLLLEKDIDYINTEINAVAQALNNINESYLHTKVNNHGWTLRHFVCLLISVNKMIILHISNSNILLFLRIKYYRISFDEQIISYGNIIILCEWMW